MELKFPPTNASKRRSPTFTASARATAKRILEQTNIDPNLRAKDLTPQQFNEIIHAITANKIMIEGDLRREMQGNLKRLQAINVIAASVIGAASGARPAHLDERPHPQRSAQDGRRHRNKDAKAGKV